MIEYIIIVILVVIAVLAYLIYQKVNTKGDDTVLTNIDTKLQTIVEAKKTMENLQGDMVDFKNLFNNRSDIKKFIKNEKIKFNKTESIIKIVEYVDKN